MAEPVGEIVIPEVVYAECTVDIATGDVK